MENKAIVLGIDYGLERCGIAISDPDKIVALGKKVVRTSEFFEEISQLLRDYQVSAIVVGLPLTLQGQSSQQTDITQAFIDHLKSLFPYLKILARDERWSSKAVERVVFDKKQRRNKKLSDMYAATFILQGYLDELQKG